MSVTKRGLLAPQNTFLENICRKVTTQNSNFVIANGRIVNYPVVYCTEAFARLFGYDRAEIMLKSACCTFLFGELTDDKAASRINSIFDSQTKDSVELLLYRRNRAPIWVLYYVAPIYNEREKVVLFVCTAKDITSVKLLENDDMAKGLGRFARLARTVTRKTTAAGGGGGAMTSNSFNSDISNSPIPTPGGPTSSTSTSSELPKLTSFTSQLEEVEYPKYMLEAPKTPPYTILHTSTFKQTWDWVLFMLTVYTAIMVPFEIVYELAQEDVFVGIIDLCVDTAFIIDIVISFRTTYVHIGGEVVSDSKRIRNNYIKGWFTLDLISSVPLEMIDMIIEQINTKEKAIFTQLRLIKLVRLLRLVRVIRRLDHYMEYAGGQLLMFLSIFLLFAHWFALVWYSIGISERDKEYNWINEMKANTYGSDYSWDGKAAVNSSVVFTSYVSSLYFTMSSMTSIGFGNIAGNTNSEKIFCIILMFVGSLLYATIFGNVTTMFQQMSSQSTRYHEMLNDIREFMKLYQVPKDLAERVMDYVVSTWAMTKGVNTDKVMNYTPKDMRADLSIHLNRHILREHPAFRLASEGCLRALAINFEMHHSAPGDLLFHTGESIEELCFIASGSLEVIQDEEVVAILGKGDVIGDKFWVEVTVGQSAVNVRALTYTDLHIISREALVEILRFYESFATSFSRNLVLAFNLRHRVRFKTLLELQKEQEMAAKKENAVDLPPDHPVRKLFSKFRGKIVVNGGTASPGGDLLATGDEGPHNSGAPPCPSPSPTPSNLLPASTETHEPKQNGAIVGSNNFLKKTSYTSSPSAPLDLPLSVSTSIQRVPSPISSVTPTGFQGSIFKATPSQRKISGSALQKSFSSENTSSNPTQLVKTKKKSMWDKLSNKREAGLMSLHDTDEHSDRLNDSARFDDSYGLQTSRSSSNLKSVRIGGQTEIQDTLISYNIQNLDSKLQESDKNEEIIKNLLDIRSDIITEALSLQSKLEKLDRQILLVAESLRSSQRVVSNESENEHHSSTDSTGKKFYSTKSSSQSEKLNFHDSSISLLNSYDISMLSAEFQKSGVEVGAPKESSRKNSKSSDDGKGNRKVLVKQKQENYQSPNLSENVRLKQQVCPTMESCHDDAEKFSRNRKNGSRNSGLPIPAGFQLKCHLSKPDCPDNNAGIHPANQKKPKDSFRKGPLLSELTNDSLDSPTPVNSTVETSFSFIDMDEKPVIPSNLPEF